MKSIHRQQAPIYLSLSFAFVLGACGDEGATTSNPDESSSSGGQEGGDGDGDSLGGSKGDGDGDATGGVPGNTGGASDGSGGDSSGGATGGGNSGGGSGGTSGGSNNGGDGSGGASGGSNSGGSNGNSTIKIVVMGSSTAAGKNLYIDDPNNGCGYPDLPCKEAYRVDRWSNKYEEFLDASYDATVVNIANPGMPTSEALPGGTAGNTITDALAENPDAIILAFPIGNDMPANITSCTTGNTTQKTACALDMYFTNLATMIKTAADAGVPSWISKTQPHVMWEAPAAPLPSDFDIHQASLDSLMMLSTGFPTVSVSGFDGTQVGIIDFWTPLLAPDPNPSDLADPSLIVTGDNGHPNIAGHLKLRDEVIAADIPGALGIN